MKKKILIGLMTIISLFGLQTLTYYTIGLGQLKNKLLPKSFASLAHSPDSVYVIDYVLLDCATDSRTFISHDLNKKEDELKKKLNCKYIFFSDKKNTWEQIDSLNQAYNTTYNTFAERYDYIPTVLNLFSATQTETISTKSENSVYQRQVTYHWVLFFWVKTYEYFYSGNIEEFNGEGNNVVRQPSDTTIKFLWIENVYSETAKDTIGSIAINQEYCKIITDQERAAIAYSAFDIGSECDWDGEAKDDRSNLSCKILTALNLGYQCSNKHLDFLRQWFKLDTVALKELQSCPTTPFTSTIQSSFEEITLTVKGSEIQVIFLANAVNMREDISTYWSETDYFHFDRENVWFKKKTKAKVVKTKFW